MPPFFETLHGYWILNPTRPFGGRLVEPAVREICHPVDNGHLTFIDPSYSYDELVKSRISDGFVKSPRSRLAARESELRRANGKSTKILTANIHVPS